MSIFGNIMSAIFGRSSSAAAAASPAGAAPAPPIAQSEPSPAWAAPSAQAAVSATPVDVAAIMDGLAAKSSEKLDWRRSIVDLMKLLNLDSSLHAREELAKELGYTGKLDGSAEMNVWLHKQVMTKLAESGGKVPDSLKA